ncbi:hypothetical protein ACFE04_000094 [Oxalis oulophora]
MTSSTTYSVDDKDLDDAALWAVIDSAAASHSAKSRIKPLAIKYSNHQQSPPTPISSKPNRNLSAADGGEVFQSTHCRPQKIARTHSNEISPLVVVRNAQQRTSTPSTTASYFSPEAYLSPGIGKHGNGCVSVLEVVSEEKDVVGRHSLQGKFPSVSLFKDYQNAAMAILEKSDYTTISGNPFIKKTGWRKIAFYFNLSFEIKDKTIEFDESRNVLRAEFVVRAHMQGGRFSDGWGSCDRREKRFNKPNHDIPSTAETRAKNKACQDLLGIGEYRPGASQFQKQT